MSEITVTGPQGVESDTIDASAQYVLDAERQLEAAAKRRREQSDLADRWSQEYAEEQAVFLRDTFRGRTTGETNDTKKRTEQPGDSVPVQQ